MALYTAQSWAKVAEHVGNASTAAQCKVRWNSFLCSAQQEGINLEDWTDEEVQYFPESIVSFVFAALSLSSILFL